MKAVDRAVALIVVIVEVLVVVILVVSEGVASI